MQTPDWHGVKRYVLGQLATRLSPDLFYHGLHHTRDDVLPAMEQLIGLSDVDPARALQLRTAALYHDIGFIVQYNGNEPLAVEIAHETLPQFGYSPEQVQAIGEIIMATQMPQQPQDDKQALMCDADLDSLGRPDYLETAHNLRFELAAHGTEISIRAWYARQLNFLSSHRFFSPAARSLRAAGKRRNIALLKELLAALEGE